MIASHPLDHTIERPNDIGPRRARTFILADRVYDTASNSCAQTTDIVYSMAAEAGLCRDDRPTGSRALHDGCHGVFPTLTITTTKAIANGKIFC